MTNVTLSLLLSSDYCQRVAGHLSRGKGHKTEEKQAGVTVVGRITLCPGYDRLQQETNEYLSKIKVCFHLSGFMRHLVNCTLHAGIGDHAEDARLESSVKGGQRLLSVNGSGTRNDAIVGAGLLQVQSHFQHLRGERRGEMLLRNPPLVQ